MQKSQRSKSKRIQELVTMHLLHCGSLELALPDGVRLEIGITKDSKHGIEISDDYCFVKASRQGNSALLDTFNVSLQYVDRHNAVLCMDDTVDEDGRHIKRLELV